MDPIDTHDGTLPASDCTTSCTSQNVTVSGNLMSSSKDSVTTNANQDRSERMEIDVISGSCASSSLVSSCSNSATTFGSEVRYQEMEGEAATVALSSISMTSCDDSVGTIPNKDMSDGTQVSAPPVASSVSMTLGDDSVGTIPNKNMSDGTDAGVSSAASSILMTSSSDSVSTIINKDMLDGRRASPAASSTLMSSSNDSVSTIANKDGTPARVASAGSSTLVTSRNSSTAVVAWTGRAEGVDDVITSTPGSTNFQEQNEDAFTDDKMFPSSDEDGEGMDWAVSEHSGVESLVQRDFEPEDSLENTRNNLIGTDDSFMTKDGPKEKRFSSEPPENSSTSSPQRINAEMVSTALAAVSGSDSFEDDMPLSLLAEVSSSVKKAKVTVPRGQKTKKKKGKGMKKNSDTPVHDGRIVEDLISGSEEIVSVLQPDPPTVGFEATSNNGDSSEGVDALGSTSFPGMDDVLQVIIEEEENDLDSSHCKTGLQTAHVNVEDKCVEINSPGDLSEGRKSELISSKEQGISFPRKESNSNERNESGGSLPLSREIHQKPNSNDDALPDEQDALELDSFCEVSNDYGNISSDEESITVLEQQKSACSTPNARVAHGKAINKQGYLSGSTQDSREAGESRAVARDQGVNESQVALEGSDHSARGASPDLTVEINNEDEFCSSVEVTNDNRVPRTLPQSTSKISTRKNKKNASAKGFVNKRSSSASAKAAIPSTTKSTGKSAGQLNGNTSEVDVETETENSQTIQKPKEESHEDVSKAKFRSRGNIFACDLQTLELLWNFKGK